MRQGKITLVTYHNAKFGELVVDLLQSGQESLLKTSILRSYGLKNLAMNVENCPTIRNEAILGINWRLTNIVLLHSRKGVKEFFNVGDAVLRVGSDAYSC